MSILRNIYDSDELSAESTVRKFRTVRMEGNRKVTRILEYYNLDMIISVGYRVNSKRGVQFRQWSTGVLKEYLLKGYAINQRVEQLENKANTHDRQLEELTNKVDFSSGLHYLLFRRCLFQRTDFRCLCLFRSVDKVCKVIFSID